MPASPRSTPAPGLLRFCHLVVAALLAGLLTACGFHLRGAPEGFHFHSLYLEANATASFTRDLKRTLARQQPDVALAERSADAEVRVRILNERRERVILSLTTAGRVREVTLRHRFTYQALDAAGEPLTLPVDIQSEQVLSVNDPDTLAKGNEEQRVYRELEQDSIRVVMLRLAALRPGMTKPAPAAAAAAAVPAAEKAPAPASAPAPAPARD